MTALESVKPFSNRPTDKQEQYGDSGSLGGGYEINERNVPRNLKKSSVCVIFGGG